MKFEIEEGVKQNILRDFINTRKRIQVIADDNKLSVEDVMQILGEFNTSGIIVIRKYGRLSPQTEEKIYNLRKNGMSYEQISSELGICIEVIYTVVKNIFKEKKEEEPQDDSAKEILSKDKEIYELRKQKKTYKEIGNAIGMSERIISKRCKEIFELKEEPYAENTRKILIEENKERRKKTNEMIYKLRAQKKTYKEISEKTGLSPYKVSKACKETFLSQGEEIPKAIYKKTQTEESKEIDQIIYNLVQGGKKYKEVQEDLYQKGIIMSRERIRQRNKRGNVASKKKLANMILNLMVTKKATFEQIQEIADYYGVDLGEAINSLDEI